MWAGKFKEKDKKLMVVLKAIADCELSIWECNFGSPGSLNDIDILYRSSIVNGILCKDILPQYEYEVSGTRRNFLYFLVDGIYPPWRIIRYDMIFVTTIWEPANRK